MYSIYVTNRSSQSVYIRLQHEKLSTTKPNFYHDLDSAKENATRHLVQCGFFEIPPYNTISFPTDQAIGGTRMYASLYALSKLWIMDFEMNCTRYGCLFVKSEECYYNTTFHLSQANPEPVWIRAKNGDALPSNILIAGPGNFFGRLSSLGTPCKVTKTGKQISQWITMSGDIRNNGELLRDTGHEFVRVKAGDDVPPHGVISGVSEPEGSMYLGRIGGNIPCSITAEGGKIKNFLYGTKKVQSGEILVLTNYPNNQRMLLARK